MIYDNTDLAVSAELQQSEGGGLADDGIDHGLGEIQGLEAVVDLVQGPEQRAQQGLAVRRGDHFDLAGVQAAEGGQGRETPKEVFPQRVHDPQWAFGVRRHGGDGLGKRLLCFGLAAQSEQLFALIHHQYKATTALVAGADQGGSDRAGRTAE